MVSQIDLTWKCSFVVICSLKNIVLCNLGNIHNPSLGNMVLW